MPNTQPAEAEPSQPRKRSHKKKEKEAPKVKKTQTTWDLNEEYALARSWLDVSEDPLVENYQKNHIFWRKIREKFHKSIDKPEDYRTPDMVSAKWRDIRVKFGEYNAIYQLMKNNWKSGQDDAQIQQHALVEFQSSKGPFTYIKIWDLLRNSSKWHLVPIVIPKPKRASKRSKTSSPVESIGQSDYRINIDLNETEDGYEEEEEHAFQDLPRPLGRRSGGKGDNKKGMGSSSSDVNYNERFLEMNQRLEALTDIGQRRLELKQKQEAEKKERLELKKDR